MNKYLRTVELLVNDGEIGMNFDTTRELMTGLQSLRNMHFSAESTELTARAIHHYNKEGIIPTSAIPLKGRKKYNFFQILWLHVVENLRKIGYSLANIKTIKEELFDKKLLNDGSKKFGDLLNFNVFEFITTLAVLAGDEMHFIVFDKGRYEFISDKSILTYTMKYSYLSEPHINVPLSEIISDLFESIPEDSPYNEISTKWEESVINALTNLEQGIIKDFGYREIDNVEVQYENGDIEVVSKKDEGDPTSVLANIFYRKEYKHVTLRTETSNVSIKKIE